MERTDMNEHMPKKPNLPVVVGGMDWSYYNDNELWKPPENRQEPKHKPKVVESDFIKSRKCTVNGEEMAEVADGFFMNLQDIDDAINNGCGMCNSVPEGEAEKIKAGKNSSVRWYSTDEYICSDCATPEVLSVFPCMKKPKTKEM